MRNVTALQRQRIRKHLVVDIPTGSSGTQDGFAVCVTHLRPKGRSFSRFLVIAVLRTLEPSLETDRFLADDIESATTLIGNGAVLKAANIPDVMNPLNMNSSGYT